MKTLRLLASSGWFIVFAGSALLSVVFMFYNQVSSSAYTKLWQHVCLLTLL